ncbi:SDR family oxidoreductase [Mucilaginibacter koreensis]
MKKTIFITGTSSGIGKATAKLFANKGWQVIATMRKPELETELNQLEGITLLPLDVTDLKQIEEITKKVLASGDIDIVLNNAGYALIGPLEASTDEQLVQQMETNFLGTVRVTQAFIPYFRAKKSGLFINTTSSAGLIGFPVSSMYDASKWALEGWAESLYYELDEFGISIKNIEPGLVATEIGAKSPITSHPAYEELSSSFFALISNTSTKVSTSEEIAEVIYEAATDGKDQLRYVCGADAIEWYARRLEVGNEAFRKEVKQMLKK